MVKANKQLQNSSAKMYRAFSNAGRFSELLPDVQDDGKLTIAHGELIANTFLPFIRKDKLDDMVSTMANLMIKLVKETFVNGNFNVVVLIQLYQGTRASTKSTLEPVYQNDTSKKASTALKPSCYMFKLFLENEIPSEQEVQLVCMLISWFFDQFKSSETSTYKPLFMIGCQQGLNRTGYIICSVITRLFAVPIDTALRCFRKAHYPGIVKQHFIDRLLALHGVEPSMFLRIPAALSIDNLIHRTLKKTGGDDMTSSYFRNEDKYGVSAANMKTVAVRPVVAYKCGENQLKFANWKRASLALNMYSHVYVFLLPKILRSIVKTYKDSNMKETDVDRIRNGLVRPVPCSSEELGKHGAYVLNDMMISIKANGRHVTLLNTWFGVFIIERRAAESQYTDSFWISQFDSMRSGTGSTTKKSKTVVIGREVKTIPNAVLRDADGAPLRLTAIECECVECSDGISHFFCFDVLYHEGKNGEDVIAEKPFGERQTFLSTILANNQSLVGGDINFLRFHHKKFYPIEVSVIEKIQKNDMTSLFDPILCQEDGYDGFILTRASSNILCSNVAGPHIKLKTMHTVDFFVIANGPNDVHLCYVRYGDVLEEFENSNSALHSLVYDASIVQEDYEAIKCGGFFEFSCITTMNTFGFRVYKKRDDICRPNHINTIQSCLKLTIDGFYVDSFRTFCREASKRKRD